MSFECKLILIHEIDDSNQVNLEEICRMKQKNIHSIPGGYMKPKKGLIEGGNAVE